MWFLQRSATLVMLAISLFSPVGVRRLAAVLLLVAVAGMLACFSPAPSMNGAQRWLEFGGYSLQPSEFAKPAFIVIIAWLFAEAGGRSDMPALPMALVLWAVLAGLLVAQPDVGQTVLISTTAGLLYLLAGLPPIGAAILVARRQRRHVARLRESSATCRSRLEKFFSAAPFENFQVGRAMQSFSEGGLFGRGPGEGTIKSVLPDAHTDYIFAVIGEEYGVIACIALLGVFAFIVVKSMMRAADEPNAADRLAIQGLALLLGLQSLINMGVNIGLLPPKGMTLPFISAGGSSMLALSITAGMLLALDALAAGPVAPQKAANGADHRRRAFTGHTPST